jgi:predicted nucleic acid-binding protein
MPWLLDTNVLSELNRPNPDKNIVSFISSQPTDLLMTSTLVVAEMQFGIEVCADPEKRRRLERGLERIDDFFAGRVLPASRSVLVMWTEMLYAARRSNRTLPPQDSLHAATSVANGCIVVSRDTRPYVLAGAPVYDPWSGLLHRRGESFALPDGEATYARARRLVP